MATTGDLKQKAEAGRSNVVDDLLLSSPRALADDEALLSPKKKIRAARIRAPDAVSSPALPFDSTEFSLQGSRGVLPAPLASLSYSSSCPFLAESTETKVEGENKKKDDNNTSNRESDSGNKEKEVVEDDDDDDGDEGDDHSGNKEKEVEKEVNEEEEKKEEGDTDSESESEDVMKAKAKKAKAKKAKKEKREKKEKRRSKAVAAAAAAAEAEEKEKQVREIEERMKRELARLEEQKERVRLELERLKSGGGGSAIHREERDDATSAKKSESESEEKKEGRKTTKTKTKKVAAAKTKESSSDESDEEEEAKKKKNEKKKKKKEKKEKKERRAESQQVATRNAAKSDADADAGAAERALSVLEDAQRVRVRTQEVVSASAVVKTNTKAAKPKKEKAKEKQKAKSESESEDESDDELQSGPTVICMRHDDDDHQEKTPAAVEDVDDGKESESESDGDASHDAKKKEAKKAKKEEKEREKRRKKEEKERERTKRKEEKRRQRAERKAKKAERKQQRKKPAGGSNGGSGLMASIDSNASVGSNDQEQLRRVEAALWSEFVPFILRESHAGLFASLAARPPPAKRRAKSRGRRSRDAGDDGDSSESSSAAGSGSESDSSDDTDTSSLSTSTSSSAASDVDSDSGSHRRRRSSEGGSGHGGKAAAEVPAELEQLMLGLHRFLTTVVCNAGFAGSDVFEATAGRLAGLGGLFAHPLGRNAFAVALKKLARQNTSFLLTEEGFQCILCLIEQVINAFDFKRYETDLSVARVIMNIASTFHRSLNGSTQFVQQFITAYTIWRDLMFWEKYFWDELAVAQRKGYQQLDEGEEKKGHDAASQQQQQQQGPGDASTDASAATPEEPEEFVPFNPTLIFVLLHSTAYNMLNWDVDVRSVRKFVTRMCKKTCLSHDQRQSIMEIVDSFAKSLLAPSEGSFDSPMHRRSSSSSGSSEDLSSRKLGVRKKSTVVAPVAATDGTTAAAADHSQPVVDKKPESAWNQARGPHPPPIPPDADVIREVLEHVIGELGRLTEEQQALMAQKARERDEEAKRLQDKAERSKKQPKAKAAAAASTTSGKVEAGKKHLEKALDAFQEVQLVQRSRVIGELVSTEKSYLANLVMTVQHFLEPFRRAKVVSEGEINLLFSNIEIIVGLSQTFLTRLEERLASWKADNRAPGEQFLSDIFALVFPFMKIYATYCGNFEDVNSYLQRNKNNEKLTRFIRQCEMQTNNKLDLPSLLIMPVQRIPRYRLLLQELIKCTAPHHADYRKLCSALEMIKNIADFVNEQTKGSRLHTMQKNFGPKADSIVEPWRVWIKDGHLRALAIVEGGKVQIIPMYVILFNDLLVYAKSPKEYLGKVHLQEAWVKDEQDAGDMQNILQFYSPSAAFLFAANSDEEKYEWIKALATNIDRQLQVDECREKRLSVLAEITKKKKKSKKPPKEKPEGAADSLVASAAAASADKKQQKKATRKQREREQLLSAFLQFHPNVIPNTAHELLTTTQRIEKTFRTLSRHFSFRNVKETTPRDGDKVKNDLDLATPPTLAFSERQLPTRAAGRPLVPPITPPKTPAPGAPLTAPARGRAASAAASSPSSRAAAAAAEAPSPRKAGGDPEPSSSAPAKKSGGFWGLWSSSNHQVATTAAGPAEGKGASSGKGGGKDLEIFRL